MSNVDLTKYGITDTKELFYNPSYEFLFDEEMNPELTGYEKGQLTELDAVNVMTGIYTGRSPKDKYIVMDENSKNTVWWNTPEYPNDNHPLSEENWAVLKDIAIKELSGKKLYVVDAFCGANKDTRMAVRFIMEVAWQAHFVRNMFIKPTPEEEANFAAFLACAESDDPYFVYSGYYNAFSYSFSSLYRADSEKAMELYSKYPDDIGIQLLKLDRMQTHEYYRKYDSPLQEISDDINDHYLKAFSQESGIQSYGEVTDYLIAYWLKYGNNG